MIVIHRYKPSWPSDFQAIRNDLVRLLGQDAKKIAHIGSTAVPGLAAKDIIDIQIGVDDLARDVRSRLSEAGYEYIAKHSSDHVPQGDEGTAGRWNKLYFHGRAGLRPCHVHVRDLSSPNHRYALLFRDYLRTHATTRMTLELVKLELARLHGNDADAYYAVKDPVYDLVWHAANEWAEQSEWRHETSPES